nr:MAG TPA: hypothetical protein [Caudoviricetes sp.]
MKRRYHYLMWKLYHGAAKAYLTMLGNDNHYIMLHLTAIKHHNEWIHAIVAGDKDFK